MRKSATNPQKQMGTYNFYPHSEKEKSKEKNNKPVKS